MSRRIEQILKILAKEDRAVTAKEIALQLDVSEKTVREEILSHAESFEAKKINVISGKKGFRLINGNHPALELQGEEKVRIQHREHYILKKMLLREEYIKLEELAEEMYISMATLNRLFKKVKTTFQKYDIHVVSRPAYGVKIVGKEMDKRLCYIHSYEEIGEEHIDALLDDCSMKKEDYYLTMYFVQKAVDCYGGQLTDVGMKNLVLHLMYAIRRVKSGKYIEHVPMQFPVSKKEKNISRRIVEQLEKEYQIVLPPEEFDYICIHLIGKRSNMVHREIVISEETERLINEINEEIKHHLGHDFSDDFELFSMLSLHIEPMLSRAMYGLNLPNPILSEVKARLPKGFECAVIASELIRQKLSLTVSEEELGYLAIHYNLAIERKKEGCDKKFLLICGSGAGTARLLEKKIEMQFHAKPENIFLCGVSELKDMDMTDIDYVVSTVKLPYRLDRKVIYIDNILSDLTLSNDPEESRLSGLLKEQLIFLNSELSSQKEVIDFLCEKLKEAYGLDEGFKELVWKREKLSSTDIGNLVAIPHPYSMCTQQSILAICTLKKAIVWNKRKVKYIFMLSFSKTDIHAGHDISEALMSLLMDPKWILQLDRIKTSDQLKAIMK